MARPLTNEEFLADPRLKLALTFALVDAMMRLQIPTVPPGLIEASVETTLLAMSDVEGMSNALSAVRYMEGG